MSKVSVRFFVGTSGWSYPHWKGIFYPVELPKSRWFDYYAENFKAVEINATFYRFFEDQTFLNWYSRAPEGFIYVLKAPRVITHRKYLEDVEMEIKRFSRMASLLENRLGLILLQLAPGTPYDPERLKKALTAFGDPGKVAVEFRHERWITEETRCLLKELGSVFCTADSPKVRLLNWVTSDTAYIRLHGRKKWYAYDYSAQELREISSMAGKMAKLGARRIYIFFNNDHEGFAPKNALTLLKMLKG